MNTFYEEPLVSLDEMLPFNFAARYTMKHLGVFRAFGISELRLRDCGLAQAVWYLL